MEKQEKTDENIEKQRKTQKNRGIQEKKGGKGNFKKYYVFGIYYRVFGNEKY